MYAKDNGPCSRIRLRNLWTSSDTKLSQKHRFFLALNAPFNGLLPPCKAEPGREEEMRQLIKLPAVLNSK